MPGPIVILTAGTRGDVQPLIALALGLRAAGRRVRLVTHAPFLPLIAERGLELAALDGDMSDLLAGPAGQAALVWTGSPLRSARATLGFLRAGRSRYARMLASAWELCRDAGLLLASLPTALAGAQIAEALEIPFALALLQPQGATGAFPSPLLPFARSLGPAANRLSHRLVERSLWAPWRHELGRWRRGALGLAAGPLRDPFGAAGGRHTPALYGFSPLVCPPPPDWPATRVVTGYWFLDRPPGWQPPAELARFLADGPPPVYVGLGSMGGRRAGLLEIAVHGLRSASQRGLLSAEQPLPPALAGGDMLAIGATWHDWLFPQVAAAVHHGGAGTTGAALRAGIPSVALPVGIDQFFWGARVAALECGPAPIALRMVTGQGLSLAVERALGAPARARAAELGAQIQAEHGVARAVEQILAME